MANGELLDEINQMVASKTIDDETYKRISLTMMKELYKFSENAVTDRKDLRDRVDNLENAVNKLDDTNKRWPSIIWMAANDTARFIKIAIPVVALLIIIIAIAEAIGITELITHLLPFLP